MERHEEMKLLILGIETKFIESCDKQFHGKK